MMRLSFYGGAGKVTGSNFVVRGARGALMVDCGIEQGADLATDDAYDSFPYDAKTIDALVVTHAHLDHVGRIPRLVREGFSGKIYLTPPTRDLVELMLRDSADILREEAARKGRDPLYEVRDVEKTLSLVDTLEYHTEQETASGLSIRLHHTGHVLGSASVRITDDEGVRLAITSDIGNSPSPLLPDWEPITDADALVMESVYGDRLHPSPGTRVAALRATLREAIARGGTVLIPAFSLERTQLMLYELSNFFSSGELPPTPVFLDSPLAIHVTGIYEKWGMRYFKPEAQREMKREKSLFAFPFLTATLTRRESDAIGGVPSPKIIIAGAGMSHGGRIGRWEAKHLPDPSSTLIIVGYQAPGTPGRRLVDGAARVRISGREIAVRAKVEALHGWSAHADRDELLSFASKALPKAKAIFVALGEPSVARFFAQRVHDYLGGRAVVPLLGQTWEIRKDGVTQR